MYWYVQLSGQALDVACCMSCRKSYADYALPPTPTPTPTGTTFSIWQHRRQTPRLRTNFHIFLWWWGFNIGLRFCFHMSLVPLFQAKPIDECMVLHHACQYYLQGRADLCQFLSWENHFGMNVQTHMNVCSDIVIAATIARAADSATTRRHMSICMQQTTSRPQWAEAVRR